MVHEVFISYASKDKQIADTACEKLENEGMRCWIAPRNIEPGQELQKTIIDAIIKSRVMVLIFSSDSNESPQVLSEVTLAFENNLVIVPFRIEDVLPHKNMEWLISTPHWLDAAEPPMENQLNFLVKSVKYILETDLREEVKIIHVGMIARIEAGFIDFVLIAIPSILFFIVGSYFAVLVIIWIYFTYFESSKEMATPGKRELGIIVTNANGERISLTQSAIRSFIKFFSIALLGIGILMIWWSEDNKALHDYAANTLVIQRK